MRSLIIAMLCGVFSVGTMAATSETIELKLDVAGQTEQLELNDFPVGATETVYAQSGTQALVTRLADDKFEIEIAGERKTIDLVRLHTLGADDAFDWISDAGDHVQIDGDVRRHIIIKTDSDSDFTAHADGEHQVFVHRHEESDLSEEELAELLAQHDIHLEDGQEAVARQVVVIHKEATSEE